MGALATASKAGAFALGGFSAIAGKKSVEAAVNLGEQVNKTKVVFRGSEQGILNWSKTTAGAFGISRREALESAGVFGNMLVPMGVARDRAGGMSKRMVELAADMASFNNASPAQTLESIRSGLAGESEPLRKYGVFLSDARLKQEAMSKGLYKGTGQLGAQAKALATYSLLFKDTKDAQGDFGRTSKSLANQQRILKAEFENVGARAGKHLLPVLTKGAVATSKFLDQMQKGKGAGGQFAKTATNIWRAAKPVASWFGRAGVNIAKFVGRHPGLTKVAAAAGLTALAIRKIPGGTWLAKHMLRGLGGLAKKMAPYGVQAGKAMGSRIAVWAAAATAGGEGAGAGLGGAFSRRAGKFKAAGKKMGGPVGKGVGLGIIAGVVASGSDILKAINDQLGGNALFNSKKTKAPSPFSLKPLEGINPLRKKFWSLPGKALGGTIPRGGASWVGERGPELAIAGQSGTRIMPAPGSRVPQLQQAVGASGAGGGGDVVVQHRTYLDGRVLYESSERHARARKARR
jgi:hypothetical protein